MAKIWWIFYSHAFEKEKGLFFILGVFLRKDGLIGLLDDVDAHSMVSKMVIEFFSRPYNS